MTFGPRTRAGTRSTRGAGSGAFTFFEIIIVLAIVAVVFLAAIPLLAPGMRERTLRDAAQEIQGIVRLERSQAQSTGERRVLEVRPTGFFEVIGGKDTVRPLPKGARLTLRVAGGGKWEKPSGQPWEFSPVGMVTPYSVRLEDGDSWLEFDVDLLTGRVAEERYAF